MDSAICTMFEGDYHFGLAGLANSLCRNGYKGSLYVGFRGDLPPWATGAKVNKSIDWSNALTLQVTESFQMHFLHIDTESHFANYKADFMLQLWDGPAKGVKHMFYFDPDIVITRTWLLFEEWATCGIALSEDVNSPLSEFHPRRVAWRRYFNGKNISLKYKENIYVNSGFIGIGLENKEFLNLWKSTQEIIAPLTGGLNVSIFKDEDHQQLEKTGGPFMPFLFTDQDALNIAIESGEYSISYIGKNGMGFDSGFNLMQHAIGIPKPWKWNVFIQALSGKPPRNVDVEFWKYMDSPIQGITKARVLWKRLILQFARGLGRFYRRS